MATNAMVAPTKAVGNTMLWRGVVSIVFGILVLAWPQATVVLFAVLFGVYAIVDGITAGSHWFNARRGPMGHRNSGWLLVGAVVSILAGLVALVAPGLTALAVALIVGAWAILLGITQVLLAIVARKVTSYWWAGLASGILAILFGLLLVIAPGAGILGFLGVLGTFVMIIGVVFIAAGIQVRRSVPRV